MASHLSVLLLFVVLLITTTRVGAGDATVNLQEVADILSSASADELESIPEELLDLIFHPSPLPSPSTLDGTARSLTERSGIDFIRCFGRELRALSAQFDPLEYKRFVLTKAGVSERQIFQAHRESRGRGDKIRSNPAVQALLEAIDSAEELREVDTVYVACKEEEASYGLKSAEGIGVHVGKHIFQAMHKNATRGRTLKRNNGIRRLQSPTTSPTTQPPTTSPTTQPSMSPSNQPSASPQLFLVGFHIEIGALWDYSFSVGGAPGGGENFLRHCIGGEWGLGTELSLLLVWRNRPNTFTQSALGEIDIGLGPHLGSAAIVERFMNSQLEEGLVLVWVEPIVSHHKLETAQSDSILKIPDKEEGLRLVSQHTYFSFSVSLVVVK